MTTDRLAAGRAWAKALDEDDWVALRPLLHLECVYVLPGETLHGPDAIIGSYRSASEWGHATFDGLAWESECALEDDGRVRVTFIDHLAHAGERHEYRCRQVVTFDDEGRARRIEHVPIAEEEERVKAFFARVGIERRPSS